MKKDKTTALLIIDLQKGFNPTEKMVGGILKKARSYDTIIATKFVNGNPLFKRVLKYPDLTKEGLKLEELPKGTKIFKKTGYGLSQPILNFLKRRGIKRVDVCGLETDACIVASMYNLWDAGIRPVLVKELSATPSRKFENAALVISKRNFAS